ncbi:MULTISPECIES: serine hydrolase domain-containing protein [Gracilimonas]|uniref:Beta-lactamase family protein n=1 Tax=Gracilimonas sediminicola TaxID=2952158 RepID=A0A9X2RH13_9BACT|nr:serine hydrolase domain-containing protein [Gracilimonas sediminicola]MCP9291374.1 beta-lactamase family protein [Gracilimonas sediminicola]
MQKRFSFLILFSFLTLTAFGQEVAVQDDIAEAEKLVESYYRHYNIPGMSVSVYRDGEIIWSRGFGYSDLSTQTPVDPDGTLFRVGSVSKTYTAAAVGLLYQLGKMDLDESIHTYVPEFPEKKYDFTVEEVAGHLAGVRHYRDNEFMSTVRYNTVTAGLEIFKEDTLLFEPGSSYSYSSYGWNLVSAAVEGASGEEFIPFMETEVFQPLGMNNTMPDYAYRDIPARTKFYINEDGENKEAPYVDNSYKWAGGGFLSTTEDMIKFGEAHLSTDFLNKKTKDRLMKPLETDDGESTNYGIGWATMKIDGTEWKGHSGGSVGGSTMFLMHLENEVIIAFAINRSSAPMNELRNELAKIFIE